MANVKINDLALAGGVSDTMQLETDIGGATENKITVAQLSDKILDTDLGLTTTVANAVQTTNATTDGLAESDVVLTAPAANQLQLTSGTTDLLVTADCTIDQNVATTADVTFNSVDLVNAIDEFSTDGTMAGDSDTAVPTEKAIRTYVAAQLGADQDNIYYVGKHGNDSNTGLKIENAFLTIQKGIDEADSQSPTSTNKYVVRVADGGTYGHFSLSSKPYINIEASGSQLSTASTYFTISDGNTLVADKITSEGAFSGNLIYCSLNGASEKCYLKANEVSSSVAAKALNMVGPGSVYASIDTITASLSNFAVSVNLDIFLYLHSKYITGKIDVAADCYAFIETDISSGDISLGIGATAHIILNGNFVYDITVGENAKLNLIVNGNYDGDITTATGSVVNIKLGSRTGGFSDSIHSGSTTSILIAATGESNINSNLTLPAAILDAQGSAPSTTDGTVYYNSSSNDFQFRENGSWVTIGTTNVWQRVGTIISPLTAGDDLDMGTGDIDAANVDVTGNYKIGTDRVLAIDPTDRAQLFVGYHAGINTQINNNAYRNTAIGHGALETNVTGDYNTAVGYSSLNLSVAENASNTAVGANSLLNATGVHNTGIGSSVGYHQSGGNYNILIGGYAGNGGSGPTLYAKSNNVMIGYASGQDTLTGSGNIFLGYNSGFSETGSNKLYIENSNSASPLIYGEFDTNLVKINGTFQSTGNVTIGDGSAGVDYTLTFDGEDNDGVITWLEDEDAFNMTGKVRITGLTPQLILNDTDDDVFVIATVDDDLHFYNNIADHNSNFKFFTKTGDGSDYISLQMYGVGTSASTSPSERLVISYSAGLFSIYSTAGGGGTDRNLRLSAGGASDQLLLDTSGDISMSGTLTVPTVTADNIGAGTSDIIYPLQANAESTTLAVPLLIENQEGGVTSATGIRFKAVNDTTDIRAKAAIFFERTDAGGVGSLHLAVEGTNDDSNVDLTDARLTIDSSGDVTLTGDLTTTGEIVGGDLTITSSTPMLTFNDTDDDVYILTTEGDDDFHLYNNISGANLFLKLFTKDGDGTDTTSLQIFGVGTSASHTNNEALKIEYNTGYTLFQIISSASGTGTRRPLRLSADSTGGSDQLLLTTDGDVSMDGNLAVAGAITLQVDTTDVSNPPTDAELDSAFGTPATVGAGWTTYLNDNGAGSNFYQIVSDGTNWWISTFTKAV